MTPSEFKILIAEPSIVIQKGLYRIFIESGVNCSIIFTNNLEDIKYTLKYKDVDFVIANVSLFFNDLHSLKNMKNHFKDVIWTGFQYSYCDNSILQEFNHVFQINDNSETIITRFRELIQEESEETSHPVNLSTREIEVLKLLVTGLSNKEIADKLNLSIHTVNTHRKNITQKSGIKSLAALIIFAVSKNYIHIDSLENNT